MGRRQEGLFFFLADEYKRMEEASRGQEHLEKKECPKPPIDQ